MDTKKSIQQLVVGVLNELKDQGYSPDTIKEYAASYMDLSAYADDNGIHEYSEAVGLGFMDFKFGFKLEVFFGTLPKNVSATLHHLLILWHYQRYQTVEFITRRRKKPFVCPAYFQKEYDTFLAYCEQTRFRLVKSLCVCAIWMGLKAI